LDDVAETEPDEQPGTEAPAPVPPDEPRGFWRRLGGCITEGTRKGLRAAAWLLAIMIPISLAVELLSRTGALGWVASLLEPAFRLIGLPGETAIAFIIGMALNVYSAIAAMSSMVLTQREVTILALMVLISHNFPVEATVQHKAGSSGWRMVALRLTASVAAGVVLHLVLPAETAMAEIEERAQAAWTIRTAKLTATILVLVVLLMILQRLLDEFGLIRIISWLLSPILRALGLPRSTAFLWIVANTLGLAYGAAVILEEAESGRLSKDDAELLNRSIAVCHSLLEDSALFVAVGAWVLWITVPRVMLAAAAVWTYRAWRAAGSSLYGPATPDE